MFSISGIETRNQAKMTIIIIRLQAEILLRLSICWPKESDYITKVVLRTLPTTVQRQHNKHWLERINVTHATVIRYPEWTQLPSDQSFFNRIIRVLISRSQDDDQWWHWHGYSDPHPAPSYLPNYNAITVSSCQASRQTSLASSPRSPRRSCWREHQAQVPCQFREDWYIIYGRSEGHHQNSHG